MLIEHPLTHPQRRPACDDCIFFVDQARPTIDHGDIRWALAEYRNLLLQFRRMPKVIGIEKSDVSPLRRLNARITGNRHATIGLMYNRQPRVSGLETFQYLARCVGRSVIDDDDFEITEGLIKNALKCGLDRRRRIIGRDNYRNRLRHYLGSQNE